MIMGILALLCGLAILVVDQLTKHYIASNYVLGEVHDFIDGLINIVFVENRGAAWGIFQGRTWLLLVITAVVMVICIVIIVKNGLKNKLLLWAMTLVLSGGVGNMIDRIFRNGIVVDFLQFDFWQSFPVFNVADCAVVIGGGLLILYFLIDTVKDFKQNKKGITQVQEIKDEEN